MKRIGIIPAALGVLAAAGCWSERGTDLGQAKSQEPDTVGGRGAVVDGRRVVAADIATQDARDFIRHVAMFNKAEIDLGRLAADHGSAEQVKRFAQMMIEDHTASGDKLKALAADLKIDAPSQLGEQQVEQRSKLVKQSGTDFDREYASAMVDGHKDLIDQLEPRIEKKTLEQWKGETNGKSKVPPGVVALLPDPSDNPTTMRINQLAAALYPTVHAHMEAAKALESSLKDQRHDTP